MEGKYQDLQFEVYVGFQKIENEGLKGETGLGKLITWRGAVLEAREDPPS